MTTVSISCISSFCFLNNPSEEKSAPAQDLLSSSLINMGTQVFKIQNTWPYEVLNLHLQLKATIHIMTRSTRMIHTMLFRPIPPPRVDGYSRRVSGSNQVPLYQRGIQLCVRHRDQIKNDPLPLITCTGLIIIGKANSAVSTSATSSATAGLPASLW